MSKIILLCGKISCGKTTYARQLEESTHAVLLSIDEIMLAVFGQDAGEKHDEYTARVENYLLQKSLQFVKAGVDVILDWGFWEKASRESVRAFYEKHGVDTELHYLDVKDSILRKRMEKRNAAVLSGNENAYFVDEGLAAKCLSLFEIPTRDEVDLWIET